MMTIARTIRFSLVATIAVLVPTLAGAQLMNPARSTPKVI
jgi:hypothetical protein